MPKFINPRDLPYVGAIFQAFLFCMAGIEFFSLPILGAVIGLGVGAVVNYSIALASSRINDIAKNRKPLAMIGLVAMLCLSPVTITLSLYYPASIFAGIAWALCVDVSIVLAGAISGKSLLPAETPQKVTVKKAQAPKVPVKVARKAIPETELLAYLQANAGASQTQVAEYFGVTRQAIGSRMKKIYAVKGE